MNGTRIELHIEALVLEGFDPRDRARIGAALEAELTRLLEERGAPAALSESGESARLDAGRFTVTPGAAPQRIGAQMAEAVYTGLKR